MKQISADHTLYMKTDVVYQAPNSHQGAFSLVEKRAQKRRAFREGEGNYYKNKKNNCDSTGNYYKKKSRRKVLPTKLRTCSGK